MPPERVASGLPAPSPTPVRGTRPVTGASRAHFRIRVGPQPPEGAGAGGAGRSGCKPADCPPWAKLCPPERHPEVLTPSLWACTCLESGFAGAGGCELALVSVGCRPAPHALLSRGGLGPRCTGRRRPREDRGARGAGEAGRTPRPEALGGRWPCRHLDSGLRAPGTGRGENCCFLAQSGMLCYGGPGTRSVPSIGSRRTRAAAASAEARCGRRAPEPWQLGVAAPHDSE